MPSHRMMGLKRIGLLVLLGGALGPAGCGGSGASSTHATPAGSSVTSGSAARAGMPPAFAWLHPSPPPSAWPLAHLIGTTTLAYPPGWHRIHSDPGTVSAALVDRHSGLVVDYVNATPQQGEETLQNWATFRPDHNREEGDSHVQVLAAGRGLQFRNGEGSCVIDRYRTPRTSYQEIACLVRGSRGTSVIVASTLAARWHQTAAELERSVSSFVA
jgi:hypothetical protein